MEEINKKTGLKPGEKNDTMDLDYCGCLGYCAQSPNVEINDTHIILSTSPETVIADIEDGGEDMSGKEIDIEQEEKKVIKGLEGDFLEDIT